MRPPEHDIYINRVLNLRLLTFIHHNTLNLMYKTLATGLQLEVFALFNKRKSDTGSAVEKVALPCNQSYHRTVYSDPERERVTLRPLESTMFSVGI